MRTISFNVEFTIHSTSTLPNEQDVEQALELLEGVYSVDVREEL